MINITNYCRFSFRKPTIKEVLFITLSAIIRVKFSPAAEYMIERQRAWREHARQLQKDIDEERQRGWGFRIVDGKRINF